MMAYPPGAMGNFDLTREQYMDKELARLYISGVHDSTEGKSWCFSQKYRPKPDTLQGDIMAALRAMPPDQLRRNAADIIVEVWRKKWPCLPDGSKP